MEEFGKQAVHWWEEDPNDSNTVKWSRLEHHGVIFPPEYEPHNVPLLVDASPTPLSPEQEEVASWWASVVGTEWETKEIFRTNFEQNFIEIMKGAVTTLEQCDFSLIRKHLDEQRELKKNRAIEVKRTERDAKAKQDEALGFAVVDSTREKIMSLMVEPPGLFRGRGQHPKAGNIKTRLHPEDITINVGKDNVVPICPVQGHCWKNVVHNNTVTWLAYYKDPKLGFSNVKYVYLAASSKFKGANDRLKYEKARKLKEFIVGIREEYMQKVRGENAIDQQLGTALYLIDQLALRVGNEKSEDEADTVGCCSLRVEHLSFAEGSQVTLDFLGKDSMRYFNTVPVDPDVFECLQSFVKGKSDQDELFDLINTSTLNDYLKSFIEGLSAKVFRTYNASVTLQGQLALKDITALNSEEKVQFYTDANREVAILCNHQKSTPKNFEVQMEKMQDQLKEKLEHLRLLEDHLRALQGSTESKGPAEKKMPSNVESTRNAIAKTRTNIKNFEIKLKMKDDNKTVALGTSKINYMDPRITVAWCKNNEVTIEKVFPKTLRSKFMWAMYVEPTWVF